LEPLPPLPGGVWGGLGSGIEKKSKIKRGLPKREVFLWLKLMVFDSVFEIIIFDLDSTLVGIEGLDWLAKQKGLEKEVVGLTRQAMEGEVKLEEVFSRKMELLAPSRRDLELLGQQYCQSVVEDAQEVIELLHFLEKEVWMMTGNFQLGAEMVAVQVGVSKNRVLANRAYHDEKGCYQGFDFGGPLSRSGGKIELVKKLNHDGRKVVFVGDGCNDLDVKDFVDLFIGYGGVVVREKVKEESSYFIFCRSLSPLLYLVLNKEEQQRCQDHPGVAKILSKAYQLLQQGRVKGWKGF
jgi:phosphoserine phosphatase